jgi:hypothetical protein
VQLGQPVCLKFGALLEMIGSEVQAAPELRLRGEAVGGGPRCTVYQTLSPGLDDVLDSGSILVYYIICVALRCQQSNPGQHS